MQGGGEAWPPGSNAAGLGDICDAQSGARWETPISLCWEVMEPQICPQEVHQCFPQTEARSPGRAVAPNTRAGAPPWQPAFPAQGTRVFVASPPLLLSLAFCQAPWHSLPLSATQRTQINWLRAVFFLLEHMMPRFSRFSKCVR